MAEVWLKVKDALPFLGLNKQSFHKKRRKGKYTVREVDTKGGKGYEVKLEGEPLNRYFDQHFFLPIAPENLLRYCTAYSECYQAEILETIHRDLARLQNIKSIVNQMENVLNTVLESIKK